MSESVFQQYYKACADRKMHLYAYAPPPDFRFEADGVKSPIIEDFRTVERYKEYKECGFNILLAQTSGLYNGEPRETSITKMVMDRAYEEGLEKVIITDERIRLLSMKEGGLLGEGRLFADEEALDKHVAELMAPYKDHPAFYGVLFRDEPKWTMFKTMGQLWKSIKHICPKAFIQCNLLPMVVLSMTNSWFPEGGDLFDRFKRYLSMFVDETGADYIMYDNYPMYKADEELGHAFYRFYFKASCNLSCAVTKHLPS